MTPELKARQEIDRLLNAAGWHVCDMTQANIRAARGVAVREFPLAQGHVSPTTCSTSTARPPASSKPRRPASR